MAASAHRPPDGGGRSLPATLAARGGLLLPCKAGTGRGQNAGGARPVSVRLESGRVRSTDTRGRGGRRTGRAAGGHGGSRRNPLARKQEHGGTPRSLAP